MLSTAAIKCPEYLLRRAQQLPAVATAVVNAQTRLVLESVRLMVEEKLIEPILVGNPRVIEMIAREMAWNIADIRCVPANDEVSAASVAVALVRQGDAQLLMKGHVHTDHLLRAVLDRNNGLRTKKHLSHVFHMTVPGSDRAICITDAVINILPGIEEKIAIARNAVSLCHALGNPVPKVALLSGTEQITPTMLSSVEAATVARKAANGSITDAIIDGPLGFDGAVSQEAANLKGIDSPVAGIADVLLVPNLESGNFLFKQMVYFMSATAAGLVLGAKVPVILTSRADPAQSRLASAAIAAIYTSYHQPDQE